MNENVIVGMSVISACLPSLATVRLQRIEQDERQKILLLVSGAVALMTIYGAIKNEKLMWFGVLCMIAMYVFLLFAPIKYIGKEVR